LGLSTCEVTRSFIGFQLTLQKPNKQTMSSQFTVTVPPGLAPGTLIEVQAPDGQTKQVCVPGGALPGSTFHVQYEPQGTPRRKSFFASMTRAMADLNKKAQTEWNSVQSECPSCKKIVTIGPEEVKAKFFSCPGCSQTVNTPNASSKFTYHTSKIADGLNRGVKKMRGKEEDMQILSVTVPPNTPSGSAFVVTGLDDKQYQVIVPAGILPGQTFNINVPRISKLHVAKTTVTAVATGSPAASAPASTENVPTATATRVPKSAENDAVPIATAVAHTGGASGASNDSSRLNSREVSTAVGAAFCGSMTDREGRANSRTVANAVVAAFGGNISRSTAPPVAPAALPAAAAVPLPVVVAQPITAVSAVPPPAAVPAPAPAPAAPAVAVSNPVAQPAVASNLDASEEQHLQMAIAESQTVADQVGQQQQQRQPVATAAPLPTVVAEPGRSAFSFINSDAPILAGAAAQPAVDASQMSEEQQLEMAIAESQAVADRDGQQQQRQQQALEQAAAAGAMKQDSTEAI
jgi:hypothetical protein